MYNTFPETQMSTEDKWSKRKKALFSLLEDPFSSRAAFAFSIFMNLVIIYSVAMILAESYPAVEAVSTYYQASDFVIAVLFGLEYTLRLASSPDRLRWVIKPLNIIDLLSTLPFFIYLIAPNQIQGKEFFIFRILRLIRLLRLGEFSDIFRIAAIAFQKSASTLVFIAYLMGLFVVFFSSAMYYAEQVGQTYRNGTWYRSDGSVSPFQNIPATMWWAVTTLTTVGYGDAIPVTWAGKLVATGAMVTGLLFVAAPVAIFGANFNETFQTEMKKKEKKPSVSEPLNVKAGDAILLKSDAKVQLLDTFAESQKALRVQLATLKEAYEMVENTTREQEEALQKMREELSSLREF